MAGIARKIEIPDEDRKTFYSYWRPWMNIVEIRFGILTNQAIRRGSFDSVDHLIAAIKAFLARWNKGQILSIHEGKKEELSEMGWEKLRDDVFNIDRNEI